MILTAGWGIDRERNIGGEIKRVFARKRGRRRRRRREEEKE